MDSLLHNATAITRDITAFVGDVFVPGYVNSSLLDSTPYPSDPEMDSIFPGTKTLPAEDANPLISFSKIGRDGDTAIPPTTPLLLFHLEAPLIPSCQLVPPSWVGGNDWVGGTPL